MILKDLKDFFINQNFLNDINCGIQLGLLRFFKKPKKTDNISLRFFSTYKNSSYIHKYINFDDFVFYKF